MTGLALGNLCFVAPLPQSWGAAFRGSVGLSLYTMFYAMLLVVLVGHARKLPWQRYAWHLVGLVALAVLLGVLQGSAMWQTMLATSPGYLVLAYIAIKSAAMVATAVASLIVMDRRAHAFLQIFLGMAIAGFAKAYDAFLTQQSSTCWAQSVWMSGCVGLAWCCFDAYRSNRLVLTPRPDYSRMASVRALLGGTVFAAIACVLVGTSATLVALSKFDVTALLLGCFAGWVLANTVALRFSWALRAAQTLMPRSCDLSQTHLPVVGTHMTLDEPQAIIDGYNTLAQQTNELVAARIKRSENAAMVKLAANVSHDIRGPLGALRACQRDFASLPDMTATLMSDAIERIESIATTLLNQHRHTAQVPAKTMLAWASDSVVCERLLAWGHELRIDTDLFDWGALACAAVPRADFQRVLANLLNNAAEASGPRGRILVTLTEANSSEIVLTLRDDGPGIPRAVLSRLGERHLTLGKPQGNGLGLANAYESVASWGGKIHVTCPPDGGTLVTIVLPATAPPACFVDPAMVRAAKTLVIVGDHLDPMLDAGLLARARRATWQDLQTSPQIVSADNAQLYLISAPSSMADTAIEDLGRAGIAAASVLMLSREPSAVTLTACLAQGVSIVPSRALQEPTFGQQHGDVA